jgi:aldose 1-epimerase
VRAFVQGLFYGNAKFDGGKCSELFTLRNSATDMSLEAAVYGGIITKLLTKDRRGEQRDIVVGYASLSTYEEHPYPYLGAVIGRYANRIGNGGKFTLEGREYQLATNNAPGNLPCHLHGRLRGFDKRVFEASVLQSKKSEPGLRLRYVSPDGEEGYPGALDLTVTYWLLNP